MTCWAGATCCRATVESSILAGRTRGASTIICGEGARVTRGYEQARWACGRPTSLSSARANLWLSTSIIGAIAHNFA